VPRRARKGGRIANQDGYIRALAKDHPFTRKYHYIFEHVMVMERHLGRRLEATECVHHVDGDRTNNALENLQLMTKSEHMRLHWQKRRGG
jgi:hypothetical protein